MSMTSIETAKAFGIEGLIISCRRGGNQAILSIEVENGTDHVLPQLDLMLVCEYELDGEIQRKMKSLRRYSSAEQRCVPVQDLPPNERATFILRQSRDAVQLQSLAAAVSSDQYHISVLSNHEEVDRVPGSLFGTMLVALARSNARNSARSYYADCKPFLG